jgi:hypothetical protein
MQMLQPNPLTDMQMLQPNHLADMQVLLHTPAWLASTRTK